MNYSQHIFVLMSLTSIITSSTGECRFVRAGPSGLVYERETRHSYSKQWHTERTRTQAYPLDRATLTPSGSTVSVDCGGQQTFTCSVTGVAVGWTITGLDGITASGTNGLTLASSYNRVNTTDSGGIVQTSTITITGFTAADDGGSVQCINLADSAVQGMATVSLGPPQCGQVGVEYGCDSCPSFTFTPQGNVLPSVVVVSYHLAADPSSAGSLNCAYPIDPQMCRLVVPGGTYTVRATPQNNCGSPSSTCSSFTEIITCNCTLANRRLSTTTVPAPTVCILSGVIPSVVLILINMITAVVAVLVTRHCYKKSAGGPDTSSRREELYEQVEGKKVYEDINMTDSPAYGPTSSQNK